MVAQGYSPVTLNFSSSTPSSWTSSILETTIYARTSNLERRGNIHHYGTRNAGTYDLPAHRLNIFKKKPSYIGAKFWNLLPAHVAQLDIKSFRRGLMNWLMDHPFYSVQEFLRWKEDYNP
ncbi:hypothetical protein J6590_014897 [Homalodisca vitripennis]|nr:hypothetical protein J6590_014897 [Homalodisca vitripennis]